MFSFLEHFFLPRPSNNHRAKILHPKGITFVLSLLIVIQIGLIFISRVRPDVLGFATDISVERLLELTNQKRLENGISTLNLNQELSQAAAGKANDMFGNNYWAHVSPSGKTPWDFIIGAGYQYVYAGENLAKDFQDSSGVVNAWMDSASHRENLMQEKYKDVGFAIVNGKIDGEETTLVVQMFGTKSPGNVVPESKKVTENIQITPSVSVAPIIAEITPINTPTPTLSLSPQKTSVAGAVGVVRKKPIFDLFTVSKDVTLFLVILLIAVLGIDAIIVSKKKIVRISGSNLAHILILSGLMATLLLVSRGTII